MIEKIAQQLFGGITRPYLDYFDSLRTTLRSADMKMPLNEYVSLMAFVSFITFFLSMIFGTVIITYTLISTAYSYTLAILLSIVSSGSVFFFGYYYPSLKAKNVRTKIERSLPFAVFYMATSASSGVTPTQIFKMLSVRGGLVGRE